jgi:GNAT superfamily N-acetyltransferase
MWGGMRSGNSPAGQTRLKFMVFDRKQLEAGVDQEEAEIGFVELFVKDGTQEIVGLVNIELNKDLRKTGYGRKLVRDIVDTTQSGLTVNDIQKRAKGFWKKQGVEFTDKAERFGKIDKDQNSDM